MKKGTAFLCMLMMLFLVAAFSCIFFFSAAAIPTTRSLKSFEKDPSSLHDLLPQGEEEMSDNTNNISHEELELELELVVEVEGRMDIESNDYPGTGANNHHDPKTPGRP